MIAIFALVLLQVPTDAEADEAVKKLKAALAESGETGQIDAIREALQVKHEKVIKSVAPLLGSAGEKVRIAAALALGDTDHPVSVDALIAAAGANMKIPSVLAAICSALAKLGWEKGVTPLHEILRKVGDDSVREVVPDALDALAQIGSSASIDPITDLWAKVAGPRRDPWPQTNQIIQGCRKAVEAITGHNTENRLEFEDWWKDNKGNLVAGAKKSYWVKKTQERVEVMPGEKPPSDVLLIGARMVDKAAEAEPKKKKKKNP